MIGHMCNNFPHNDQDIEKMLNEQMEETYESLGYETEMDVNQIHFKGTIHASKAKGTNRSTYINIDSLSKIHIRSSYPLVRKGKFCFGSNYGVNPTKEDSND